MRMRDCEETSCSIHPRYFQPAVLLDETRFCTEKKQEWLQPESDEKQREKDREKQEDRVTEREGVTQISERVIDQWVELSRQISGWGLVGGAQWANQWVEFGGWSSVGRAQHQASCSV